MNQSQLDSGLSQTIFNWFWWSNFIVQTQPIVDHGEKYMKVRFYDSEKSVGEEKKY